VAEHTESQVIDERQAARLDAASETNARAFLMVCCASTRWVERMLARRPFRTSVRLHSIAREEWFALAPDDWREAFGHHPRIGDRDSLRARFPRTAHLSDDEQRGVARASDETLDALAAGNREYEEKFGYIFIVCATGKSAEEMLRMLHARLRNDPQYEIRIAAEQQAQITALRLARSTLI
jgi:2-oxo-4-hydroxy-4-carboxy-5-ureidoimidazoline decarboxylase